MPTETVQQLPSWQELLEASGQDPFVRYDVGPAFAGGWAVDGAVAFLRRTPSGRTALALLGSPAGVGALVATVAADPAVVVGHDVRAITLPQPLEPLLERHFRMGAGSRWEWMWTQEVPQQQPAETALRALGNTADAGELTAFLADASPTASARPGDEGIEWWVGARDGSGTLVACGALQRTGAGSPHLAGIAVRPDRRGEGLGAAVTAALTRRAITLDGVSTLGMYSDNAVARSLYLRLGYRVAQAWATRVIRLLG
ncbi:GNAT family N-acetyltransferase [Oryzihumus leptocrescens]|uniref:FR47-like protein n=1 Tax=Oryzihumus leptocrescens TaxID=297536 RepID=A0A542ZKB4_9MICO|nr:GNAT family N-acetyltransferase [Oryzihumus leptocrescens]TQL60784.1 FR47-like protein [Oryzihumus leptocrescens]